MTVAVIVTWDGNTPPATIAQEIADVLLGKHPELWGFITPVPSVPSVPSAVPSVVWRVTAAVWNIRTIPSMLAPAQVVGQLHAGDVITQLEITADSWVRHAAGWSHTNGLARVT